jgi:hypothetical protein
MMYLGWSMTGKSLSLIVIEDSFHRITSLGMTQSFLKGKTATKEPPKRKFSAEIIQKLDDLKETKMVCLKVTV